MDQKWRKVTQEEFEKILSKQEFLTQHTIGFCDPPIRFFWNKKYKTGDDWSFGQQSFAKIIMDYEIMSQPPPGESGFAETLNKYEYYILEDK